MTSRNPVSITHNGYFPPETRNDTALGAGEVWTSDPVFAEDYASVAWFAISDQPSATLGCTVETSYDGVTFSNVTDLSHTLEPNTAVFRILTGASRYYRIKFTNGSTPQGFFSAYLKCDKRPLNPLSATRNQVIHAATDVNFSRPASDFLLDVARSRVRDHAPFRKFGSNPTVGTTEELVWFNSSAYAGFLTSASAVRIASGGNANDDAAGTGAREITVEGLDENFEEASETIATAGTSASSATTTTFIRINRAYVSASGTYTTSGLDGSNVGGVIIETTGGTTLAAIESQAGQTQLGFYTVPANKQLQLERLHLNVAGGKPCTIRMYQRRAVDDTSAPVEGRRLVLGWIEVDGSDSFNYDFNIMFPEKTDIILTAKSASGTSSVDVEFTGILIDV